MFFSTIKGKYYYFFYSMKIQIQNKIDEIFHSIQNQNVTEIGLLNGLSGVNLFLFYYSKNITYNKEKIDKSIADNFLKIINTISKGSSIHTHCSGLSGFMWSLEHFIKNCYIEREDCDILNQLDELLSIKMKSDLNKNNLDFLHGAIGCGLYFVNHLSEKNSIKYLDELVDGILMYGIKGTGNELKWEYTVTDLNDKPKKAYNISLSHGMSSIIAFMSKAKKCGYNNPKIEIIVEGGINFLLNNIIDHTLHGSYFSSWVCIDEPISGSRLAWCYGDLGIASAIWQAGNIFCNEEWKNKAIEVFQFAATRKHLGKNAVMDAGLCHGTAGIGHIFYRMWWNTKHLEFKDAADYWFSETLKMASHKDGLAGYKTWHTEKYGGFQNEVGVLDGVSGIGLALLSYCFEVEPTWDECLLLS